MLKIKAVVYFRVYIVTKLLTEYFFTCTHTIEFEISNKGLSLHKSNIKCDIYHLKLCAMRACQRHRPISFILKKSCSYHFVNRNIKFENIKIFASHTVIYNIITFPESKASRNFLF